MAKLFELRKTIYFIGFILAIASYAQPSDAVILSKVKSFYASNKNVISAKLYGTRGGVRKEVEKGILVSNFYRSYTTKSKTNYDGVISVYHGMVKYGYRNGSWVFLKKLIGENSYDGVPNPTWKEVEKLIAKNKSQFLGSYLYGRIVGDIESINFAKDPKWNWKSMKNVEFYVTAIYKWKKSNIEIEKVKNTFKVRLFADKVKGPWMRIIHGQDNKESLGIEKYSAQKIASMKTLRDIDAEKQLNQQQNALPKIQIPSFSNNAQMTLHFHKLMMKGNEAEIEAFLRASFAKSFFNPQIPAMLMQRGSDILDRVKKSIPVYKNQYCDEVRVKHNQKGMVEWFNKNASRYSRFVSRDLGNGKREIADISIYTFPEATNDHKNLKNISCK